MHSYYSSSILFFSSIFPSGIISSPFLHVLVFSHHVGSISVSQCRLSSRCSCLVVFSALFLYFDFFLSIFLPLPFCLSAFESPLLFYLSFILIRFPPLPSLFFLSLHTSFLYLSPLLYPHLFSLLYSLSLISSPYQSLPFILCIPYFPVHLSPICILLFSPIYPPFHFPSLSISTKHFLYFSFRIPFPSFPFLSPPLFPFTFSTFYPFPFFHFHFSNLFSFLYLLLHFSNSTLLTLLPPFIDGCFPPFIALFSSSLPPLLA